MNLAPVAFFTFNRPIHAEETLKALAQNELANQTDLYVFIDGPRSCEDQHLISQVNSVVSKISGFKSIKIIHRPFNYGVAKNIIDGVTDVVGRHGKIIVVEDDILTSPHFLTFMNNALSFFKDIKRVWHISGYMEPIRSTRQLDTFFWRVMDCWGWGTWGDRWRYYEKDPQKLVEQFSDESIHRFNLEGGYNFWSQVLANLNGEINTWAIFWYATIFQREGLCLSPYVSYTQNIGFDGSGIHCGLEDSKMIRSDLNQIKRFTPPSVMTEDPEAVFLMKEYLTSQSNLININEIYPNIVTSIPDNNLTVIYIKIAKKVIPSRIAPFIRKIINSIRGLR